MVYNEIVKRDKVKADVKRKPTRNDQIRRGQDCKNRHRACRQHRAPANLNPYSKKESAPQKPTKATARRTTQKGKPIIAWFAPQSKGVYHEQHRNFDPR